MIFQSLYSYYQRKANDPESTIAAYGMEWKEIPFLIVIDLDGNFVNLEDTREGTGKIKIAKRFHVVKSKGRSGKKSWQICNMLWDTYEYVLGYPKENSTKTVEECQKDADLRHSTFSSLVQTLKGKYPNNDEFKAVSRFYESEDNMRKVFDHQSWGDCLKIAGCNLSFRVRGQPQIVAENKDLVTEIESLSDEGIKKGICLITGEKRPLALLHSGTTIPGGKAGAKIVGFQKNSGYDSYDKSQGFNAPVSIQAEAAYTTALNTLLGKESQNKCNLAGTTYVFWADRDNTGLEKGLSFVMNQPPRDDPDKGIQEVKTLLESVQSGDFYSEGDTQFYLLGLSPNAARISIRFWQKGTVRDISRNLSQHFRDLTIVRGKNDSEYYSLFTLLSHTALEYKIDNVPPNLASAVVKAVLDGTRYPETLQMQCLRRNKAEQKITYIRASILKACLNRKIRINTSSVEKEITVALDTDNVNPGYLCGRLFAVLEKIQAEAHPGLNATIKDRYYGAASSTPVTVFGRLLNLSNHHLAQLKPGRKINLEKLLQSIIAEFSSEGFPAHLSIDDQSRFAIGYYQQRLDLFTKKETQEVGNE